MLPKADGPFGMFTQVHCTPALPIFKGTMVRGIPSFRRYPAIPHAILPFPNSLFSSHNKGQYAEVLHFFSSAYSVDHEGLCQKLPPHSFQLALSCWNEPLSSLRSFRSQRIYIKCLNHVQTLNTVLRTCAQPCRDSVRVGKTSTNLHYQNQGSMQSGCPCNH